MARAAPTTWTRRGGGGDPGRDTTKPAIDALSFSSSTFRAAGSGGAFGSQKKKRRRTPTGTKISFSVSEPSIVKFTVERSSTGRQVSGKCRSATRKNRTRAKCTLWKTVRGSATVPAKTGKNTFTFRGRMGGRRLAAGGYRLSATATDSAKNASLPKRQRFRIVR